MKRRRQHSDESENGSAPTMSVSAIDFPINRWTNLLDGIFITFRGAPL